MHVYKHVHPDIFVYNKYMHTNRYIVSYGFSMQSCSFIQVMKLLCQLTKANNKQKKKILNKKGQIVMNKTIE